MIIRNYSKTERTLVAIGLVAALLGTMNSAVWHFDIFGLPARKLKILGFIVCAVILFGTMGRKGKSES
jgi:hypothetical protein